MLRDRLKRLNSQHTVMGAVLAWLLYLVNFSGAVAMFVDEFQVWEEPAARVNSTGTAPMQPILDRFVEENGPRIDFVELTQPTTGSAFYNLRARVGEGDNSRYFERVYAVDTGLEVTLREGDGVSRWLEYLHRYLAIQPKTIGRIVVGLTGVYMLVLLLSGVVIHQRIARDLFKIRWHRSLHLKWKDLHNATGLWTLPFAIVIAFSGVMVGAVVLVAGVGALPLTGGDTNKLEALLGGTHSEATFAGAMPMFSADAAMAKVASETGFTPIGVNVERYGDSNASYAVLSRSPDELVYVAPVPIDARTGEILLDEYSPLVEGIPESVAARVFTAMSPLHYGLYGPLTLKILYYLLGMALSVCIAAGMLIYFERRLNGPVGSFSQATYFRLSLVNAGVLAGLPLVTLMVFYLDRLFMDFGESRYVLLGSSFFAAWVMCVAYCCWLQQARKAARQLMWMTVALGVGLPLFDLLTIGHGILNTAVLVVHGTSAGSALGLFLYLRASPATVARPRKRATQLEVGAAAP